MPSTQLPTLHRELQRYTDPASNLTWTASANVSPGIPFHLSSTALAGAVNTLTIAPVGPNRITQLVAVQFTTATIASPLSALATISGLAGGGTLSFQITASTIGGNFLLNPGILMPAVDQSTSIVVSLAAIAGAATAIVAVGSYA